MPGVLRRESSSGSDTEWEYLESHPTSAAAFGGAAEVETHAPSSGGGVHTKMNADARLHQVTAVYEERLRVLQATNEGLEATIRDMEAAQQLRELEVAGLRETVEAMTRETQQREQEASVMRAAIEKAIEEAAGLRRTATKLGEQCAAKDVRIADLIVVVNILKDSIENTPPADNEKVSRTKRLESVNINGTEFLTLTPPVDSLHAWRRVTLKGSGITAIQALRHATQLKEVYLTDTKVTDITPLTASLRTLKKLWLGNSSVTSIAAIAGATQLEEVNLTGTNVTDTSMLPRSTRVVR
ncbi:hypothetical protein NESM_000886500 [Novymonas esmeraldas]|uniref:Uncharacterized protein n=1 Tax=Novymonas esmeraldas TaxID=1808958 RepID=A0AAW0F194_9TRYP